jgi:hypothetical protein
VHISFHVVEEITRIILEENGGRIEHLNDFKRGINTSIIILTFKALA